MSALYAAVGLVALQRGAELAFAAANTRRLRHLGAVEIDRDGYPWLVALHAGWLAATLVLVPAETAPSRLLLALFAALQLGRLWVIVALGRRWTTRIIVRPGAALIAHGPYRYLRHPNYAVVTLEIIVLPLAFGAAALALAFSVANLLLLRRRIGIEDRALAAASRLRGGSAPRVEALDVPALGAGSRVDDGVDQRRPA